MARVRLICGGQRSERAHTLNALMWEHWDHGVFLLPTRRAAARRSEALILEGNRAGAWGRKVTTFEEFLRGLLQSEHSAAEGIDECERRLLLERVVNRLRSQDAFGATADAVVSDGFLSHMLRVISDLKQAAIEPSEFRAGAARRKNGAPLDAVVAAVYEAYQAALLAVNAYDTQGLYWESRLLCERGRPRALANVRVLLLDGFDDFTPSEFRLLVSLAPYLDELVVGLNCDPERPSRRDLDAIPLDTMNRLREEFEAELITLGEPEPASYTEFAASHLFWRDRPPSPTSLAANLEIQPCLGALHEVETIGRRIKALLLDGTPAAEIAVVYRDAAPVMGTLRSVFSEFGIPLVVHEQPRLCESAVGTYGLSLLEAIDGWKREDVVGVLTSPWFNCSEEVSRESLDAVPLISRAAGIVEGYSEWESRLTRLAAALERESDPSLKDLRRRAPGAAGITLGVLACLKALKEISDGLGDSATPDAFAKRLDEIFDKTRIAETLERAVPEINRDAERNALSALRGVLGMVNEWYSQDERPEAIPRAEFVTRLRQLLRTVAYAYPNPPEGVSCISAAALRGLRFEYVFFGGVNEGDVPKPAAVNAIYSDDDIEDLREAGIKIEGRRRQSQREIRLFQHVFEAVRRRLCVTWRTAGRGGSAALASPFLADALELFPECGIAREAPRAADITAPPAFVSSWRDLRNAAFAGADGLRAQFGEEFAAVRFAASLESRRHTSSPFDAFDGALSDPERVSAIARRFGPDHSFSVNQIETYLACPFRFFMERILEVEDAEPPVSEFDDLVRGLILHAVLERFHRHYARKPVTELSEPEAEGTIRAIVYEMFDARAWRSVTAPPGVVEIERRRMHEQMLRYLRMCRERDGEAAWAPSHFEAAFGRTETPSADSLSREEPFSLVTEAGPVLFSGRVDRVDMSAGAARIIDYKTSYAPRPKDIQDGQSIQLTLYALALENFLAPGTDCAEAYYVPVGKKRWVEGLGKAANAWEGRAGLARRQVGESVAGIRAGRFAPMPQGDECARCSARRPCRYESGRIERKAQEAYGPDS